MGAGASYTLPTVVTQTQSNVAMYVCRVAYGYAGMNKVSSKLRLHCRFPSGEIEGKANKKKQKKYIYNILSIGRHAWIGTAKVLMTYAGFSNWYFAYILPPPL